MALFWLVDVVPWSGSGAVVSKILQLVVAEGDLAAAARECWTDRFGASLVVMWTAMLMCFCLDVVTGNYSWVDRIWSIVPAVYVAILTGAFHSFDAWRDSPRMVLLTISYAAWGVRLTFNFWRKGGYGFGEGSEDYRWAHVRTWFKNYVVWEVFHILFICVYQNYLLWAIAIPSWISSMSSKPFGMADIFLFSLFWILLIVETIADQQQWNFQAEKYSWIKSGKPVPEPYASGFLKTGLFRYSRHPNFFAELGIWFVMYLISCHASGVYLNFGILGWIQLMALFQGSTDLTERISAAKYPGYKQYQSQTNWLLPWIPRKIKEH